MYIVEPIDNFFFRSAVPFESGGETTTIASRFPPLPSVYAGALRPLTDPVGGKHQLKIGLNGLWLNDQFHFPLPLDLHLIDQPPKLPAIRPLALTKTPLSSYPLPYMLHPDPIPTQKNKASYHPYLAEDQMSLYLNDPLQVTTMVDINDRYLSQEPKLGIAIDPATGTVKDRQLYQLTYIRPHSGLKLAVDVQGIATEQPVLHLGGERKLAQLQLYDHPYAPLVQPTDSRYFKLYLATPAIFQNGWLPGWIDPHTLIGFFKHKKCSIKVQLISACIGRKIPCGSFGQDPADGRLKPHEMRYAVPAGSVYYFKLLGQHVTFADALKLFHQKCISDYREGLGFDYQVFDRTRYCDRGFGYALVGHINQQQEEILHVR